MENLSEKDNQKSLSENNLPIKKQRTLMILERFVAAAASDAHLKNMHYHLKSSLNLDATLKRTRAVT